MAFANNVTDTGRRFELEEQGAHAWADYRVQDGRLIIPHVEADYALRGTGAAGRVPGAHATKKRLGPRFRGDERELGEPQAVAGVRAAYASISAR